MQRSNAMPRQDGADDHKIVEDVFELENETNPIYGGSSTAATGGAIKLSPVDRTSETEDNVYEEALNVDEEID